MFLEGEGFLEWSPIEDCSKGLDVCDISWKSEGLVFTLVEELLDNIGQNQKYELIWSSSDIISYHVTDETYRADCWGKTEEFNKSGRFYARKKSAYLERMQEMSPLFPEEAIHFTIVGTNVVVDVIAKNYPRIK